MTGDMKRLVIFLISVIISELTIAKQSPLKTVYEWKQFDYVWKSKEQKNEYISKKLYVPAAMAPIDVDKAPDGRIFITVIKGPGVPATLHTVSKKQGKLGHLLEPYPDWSWYDPKNPCKGIVNVYRVAIDECNRLWVLDTGSINFNQICPAKLLAFNLRTNKLIFESKFDDKIIRHSNGTGLLVTPIVETSGKKCKETTVYIADVQGRALIIWSKIRTVRLENKIFRPDYNHVIYHIAGESFYLDDGILGMALSPCLPDGKQYLVFRPLASTAMYAASTDDLHAALDGGSVKYTEAQNVLPSQAAAQAFSSKGALFYGLTEQIAIGCWNINRPMVKKNFKIVLRDHDRLQFVSGMKVIKDSCKEDKESLLMISNRLQKIYNGTLSPHEINFRILKAPVESLIKGTICDLESD